jgi:hypothetical protein
MSSKLYFLSNIRIVTNTLGSMFSVLSAKPSASSTPQSLIPEDAVPISPGAGMGKLKAFSNDVAKPARLPGDPEGVEYFV